MTWLPSIPTYGEVREAAGNALSNAGQCAGRAVYDASVYTGRKTLDAGQFLVTNKIVENVARIALASLLGPGSLALALGYAAYTAFDGPDLLKQAGMDDPKSQLLLKGVVIAAAALTGCEVFAASAEVLKVLFIAGSLLFIKEDLFALATGRNLQPDPSDLSPKLLEDAASQP